MRADEFDNPKEKFVEMFRKFLPLAMEVIGLRSLPTFEFDKNLDTGSQPSFGMYSVDDKKLYVALANRHPNDILRTVAHELVHFKQHTENQLNDMSGETGSPEENEAHHLAGIVMRHFNKNYPEYLKGKPVVSESWSEKYKRSINCSNPKGFSQRAHCQGRKKNEDFDLDERKRKKIKHAAYGPGPYGWYGYDAGYSGDAGGDGGAAESAGDRGEIPTGPGEQLIPFPPGTTMVDVSDIYDWYKLGMVISDLDDADPKMFGQGAPHTVIAFGSEEEEHKLLPLLKRLGLSVHDIDSPEDVKQAIPAKMLAKDLAETIRKVGSQYRLVSKSGKNLGTYPSKAGAEKRERQVQYFKHVGEDEVEENFADGCNPQDKGDSVRHGIRKGMTIAQLKKIRSSKTASPRKKQLAHWQINMRQGKSKD